jgi:hypothetical protein
MLQNGTFGVFEFLIGQGARIYIWTKLERAVYLSIDQVTGP